MSDGERSDASLRGWSSCAACGFQGVMEFSMRVDENYADEDALGVMLDSACPACAEREAVLVSIEEFREMLASARARGGRA